MQEMYKVFLLNILCLNPILQQYAYVHCYWNIHTHTHAHYADPVYAHGINVSQVGSCLSAEQQTEATSTG